ncbi:MAG TPA: hypothetical protein VIH22_12770 [Cyclobacteriaceae bacterium]|jgi:hypothetical protein
MKNLLLFLVLILAVQSARSQSSSILALKSLQGTAFFNEYRELQERSQTAVKNFKLIQDRYSKEEVDNVIYAYNSSADYFNAALENIKADLLNKEKRRYLITYPESYSKQVEADLYRAKEYYANTFQKEVTALTNGQITGAALVALLPQVIKYAKLAIELIRTVDSQIKKMNETILDQYLIQPYRFKSWDEIQ